MSRIFTERFPGRLIKTLERNFQSQAVVPFRKDARQSPDGIPGAILKFANDSQGRGALIHKTELKPFYAFHRLLRLGIEPSSRALIGITQDRQRVY